MEVNKLHEAAYLKTCFLGMQSGVIPAAGKYGLGLDEKLIAEYFNELNYSSHIVGKVSHLPEILDVALCFFYPFVCTCPFFNHVIFLPWQTSR